MLRGVSNTLTRAEARERTEAAREILSDGYVCGHVARLLFYIEWASQALFNASERGARMHDQSGRYQPKSYRNNSSLVTETVFLSRSLPLLGHC